MAEEMEAEGTRGGGDTGEGGGNGVGDGGVVGNNGDGDCVNCRTRSRSRERAAGGYGGERRSDRRDKFAPY